MCVHKLYLHNNKLDFNPVLDRVYNYVNCGQCEECLRQRANDFEVRSLYEYDASISTFYYTFTYNDDHLPKFVSRSGKEFSVFSKYDVQCFLKRLRKYLKTKLGIDRMRYFISSEYGHKTLRPHYHALFFFPCHVFSTQFYDAVKSSWQNGFIYPGRDLGRVSDVRPCRYVAKYIQKDIFSISEIDKKGFTPDDYKCYLIYKNTVYKAVNLLPFHLQSRGFGISMLSHLSDDDFVRGFVYRTDALGAARRVNIPMYIYRKRAYEPYINANGNISYVLRADAFPIFSKRLKNNYEHLCTKFEDLFEYIRVNFESLVLPKKSLFSYENFVNYKNSFISSGKVPLLACYVLLWRGYDFVPFQFRDFNLDLKILCDWQLDLPFLPFLPTPESLRDRLHLSVVDVQGFEFACSLLDEAVLHYSYDKYLEKVSQYNVFQQELSRKTGKIKLVTPKTFKEFTNFKQSHLCLNMLLSRHENLKCHLIKTTPKGLSPMPSELI